jgi:hypothetical protein
MSEQIFQFAINLLLQTFISNQIAEACLAISLSD